jgi:hypothetical protein
MAAKIKSRERQKLPEEAYSQRSTDEENKGKDGGGATSIGTYHELNGYYSHSLS